MNGEGLGASFHGKGVPGETLSLVHLRASQINGCSACVHAGTRLADREDPVPDEIWDGAAEHYDEQGLAVLLLAIATSNLYNRLNAPTRRVAGASMPSEFRGADEVARFFLARRAEAARLALVNGLPAAVWAPAGRPQAVFAFAFSGDKITGIGLIADPDQLRDLDIVFLTSRGVPARKAAPTTRP